ncbi:sushi, von Willebrand factor type A, EGF and pentraxin domain-containing protein 1-like isoform X1 [Oscarella lobularis]|uniref:sushi, von Willebrand factor type A, EGF and pentraxin domain-containing protein 1-like isoform X1 n=1 Tax=Oscarella lobularis TaxID=121494 RepID=UPI0033143C36
MHLFYLVLMLTATLGGSLALRCFRPRPPRNGDVHVVNETATFSCKSSEGYVLSGSPTSVCQPGSWYGYTWTRKVPKCRKRYCARLFEPENGRLNLTRHLAFFRCQDGFRLVGSRNRTCLHNGTKAAHWSGSPVWCSPCAAPPAVKRGFLVEQDRLTAKYACKRRHSMIGDSTILCNASSNIWASPATCVKTGCPNLHHPLNGVVHYNKKLSHVHYTCNQGYLLFGSPYRSCNETTGRWSGSRPSCTSSDASIKRFKHCGVLGHPLRGQVSFDEVSYTKLEATYTCNPGFFRHGNERRVCISYRQKWSGSTAKCMPCPPISEHLRNGRVTVSRNRAYYTCDHGYNLKGRKIRRCNRRTHRWSNSPPRCTHFCRRPNAPLQGSVLIDGFFANYSCISGHRLVGPSSIQCVSGRWVSDPPSCVLGCSTALGIDNGNVYINGSVAVYSCKSGYRLAKESKRYCKKSSWRDSFYWDSSREPWCTRCLKPVAPKNGRVTERENEATYDCDYKFALLGAETLTCTESGKWSAPAPVCMKPKCGLVKIDYSLRVAYSEFNGTWIATFTCRYGQNLFGDEKKFCKGSDTRWRGSNFDVQLPTCSSCPILELDNGNVVQDGVSATYSCNVGFRLDGSRTRTCVKYSGKWSGCPPVCSFSSEDGQGDPSEEDFYLTCCSPPKPPNGSVVLTSPRKGVRLAKYICDSGFRLTGRGHTRECSSSFNYWLPGFEPSCSSTCPSLSNPRKGEVLVIGSRAVYSCHAPFILYGNAERLCSNVTRQWIGEAPVCSSCSAPPDLVNGLFEILGTSFPFSLHVRYACNESYRLVGISDNYCSDGEWLAPVPFCSVCPPPPRSSNEFVQELGSVATYICSDRELVMYGDSSITCNALTKKWSKSKRSCVPRSCLLDYNVPLYGKVERSLNPTFVETFSCVEGFEIVGDSVRHCINGSWNGPLPTCKQIQHKY